MMLSMATLLLHESDVPATARTALRAATTAPANERNLHLEAAARALYREAHLDCADARELVGLGTMPRSGCEPLDASPVLDSQRP